MRITSRSIAVTSVALNVVFVIAGLFVWRFTRSDTVYAPAYSEEKFDSIHCSMTKADVFHVLGAPIEVTVFDENSSVILRRKIETSITQGEITKLEENPQAFTSTWVYTAPGLSHGSYDMRVVRFDRNGKVHLVHKSFYVD